MVWTRQRVGVLFTLSSVYFAGSSNAFVPGLVGAAPWWDLLRCAWRLLGYRSVVLGLRCLYGRAIYAPAAIVLLKRLGPRRSTRPRQGAYVLSELQGFFTDGGFSQPSTALAGRVFNVTLPAITDGSGDGGAVSTARRGFVVVPGAIFLNFYWLLMITRGLGDGGKFETYPWICNLP